MHQNLLFKTKWSKAKPETLVLSGHLSVLLPLSVKLHCHLCLISHPLSTIPFLTSTSIIPLNLLFSRSLIRSTLLDFQEFIPLSSSYFMTQAAFIPTQLKLTTLSSFPEHFLLLASSASHSLSFSLWLLFCLLILCWAFKCHHAVA